VRRDVLNASLVLHAEKPSPQGRQAARNIAGRTLGNEQIQLDDRLQKHRVRLPERLEERARPGDLETHLVRVDVVRLAVEDLDLDVDDAVAGHRPAGHRLADALLDLGDERLRDRTADDRVAKRHSFSAIERPDAELDLRELAAPASLLLVPELGDGRAGDGLAERDPRRMPLGRDAVATLEALELRLDVQRRHP
jgi:hypothetical protein